MVTRAATRSSIRATLDQLKEWLAAGHTLKLSEADTKAGLIDKYLAALGYREFLDIQREYPVKGTQERIDYLLRDGGLPILAIEAKALQQDLAPKAAASSSSSLWTASSSSSSISLTTPRTRNSMPSSISCGCSHVKAWPPP